MKPTFSHMFCSRMSRDPFCVPLSSVHPLRLVRPRRVSWVLVLNRCVEYTGPDGRVQVTFQLPLRPSFHRRVLDCGVSLGLRS